jgi:hypothetical protein
MLVRETDCFEKRNGQWKLIHQHASLPSGGGDWDGKVTTLNAHVSGYNCSAASPLRLGGSARDKPFSLQFPNIPS